MSVIELADDGGATIKVMDLDGYYLPAISFLKNQEEEVRSIPNWKARDDDVVLCTYPKSGTHWIWEVSSMLANKKAERIALSKGTGMLELTTQSVYDKIPSPRVLNSHMYFEHLPKDFINRKCKIIYAVRNPKDVAVSFFNHHIKLLEYGFEGKWEDYVPRYLKGDVDYGTWFDYTRKWEKVIRDNPEYPILVTSFEDMKENGVREAERIAKFLEVEYDQAFLQEVVDLCQFDRMKKEKNAQEEDMLPFWKDKQPGMYRKGEVGDWKNWFTVAQNEHFDRVYEDRMKDSGVKVRFTLDSH